MFQMRSGTLFFATSGTFRLLRRHHRHAAVRFSTGVADADAGLAAPSNLSPFKPVAFQTCRPSNLSPFKPVTLQTYRRLKPAAPRSPQHYNPRSQKKSQLEMDRF
jgi:hypothetical protein